MLNFDQYEVLTFDCYGTLIDWETGILCSVQPILARHGIQMEDVELLKLYGELETKTEEGSFKPYKEVLGAVLKGFGKRLGFDPMPEEIDHFQLCVREWPPFSDSTQALRSLQKKYKLAILSNIDDDLFSHSANHLQINFDYVMTAEQIGSYKPSIRNFEFALEKLPASPDKILHVAQSLFHDIKPAKEIGLNTVWVNRRKGKTGSGATPRAEVEPDAEVPDLQSLVKLIGLE